METLPMEDAISEWPLVEFKVAVVVDDGSLHGVEDFLMQCKRTPFSPPVMCMGNATSAQVAALLELGADDVMPYDHLEDLGPMKVQVLMRRQRDRIRASKQRSASVGLGRFTGRVPSSVLSTVEPYSNDQLIDLFQTRRAS